MASWDPQSRLGPRAPGLWLVLTALSLLPWSAAVNLWFAQQGLYRPLLEASGGWLQPALQVCLPSFFVYLAFFRLGGLRAGDVGLRPRNFWRGALTTVLLWLLCNSIALVALTGSLQLSAAITSFPVRSLGELIAQLFGNALLEETLYRGFFLTQLLRWFHAQGMTERKSLWLAVLLSALAFALPHIPNRIFYTEYDGLMSLLLDQSRLLATGCFLAWVYLRTKNLWWMIGMHSLANTPTLLVEWESSVSLKLLVSIVATILTLAWPWTQKCRQASKTLSDDDDGN